MNQNKIKIPPKMKRTEKNYPTTTNKLLMKIIWFKLLANKCWSYYDYLCAINTLLPTITIHIIITAACFPFPQLFFGSSF